MLIKVNVGKTAHASSILSFHSNICGGTYAILSFHRNIYGGTYAILSYHRNICEGMPSYPSLAIT